MEEMVKGILPETLVRMHFDEPKFGKGAYLIFNNEDKDKGRMGDRLRSTARIDENVQLDEIDDVLTAALSAAKSLRLVSFEHQIQNSV